MKSTLNRLLASPRLATFVLLFALHTSISYAPNIPYVDASKSSGVDQNGTT